MGVGGRGWEGEGVGAWEVEKCGWWEGGDGNGREKESKERGRARCWWRGREHRVIGRLPQGGTNAKRRYFNW